MNKKADKKKVDKPDSEFIRIIITIPKELKSELNKISGNDGFTNINDWIVNFVKNKTISYRRKKLEETYEDLAFIEGE